MIDLEGERLISLAEAARMLPGRSGGPLHAATVGRWVTRGAKGPDGRRVRLEAARVGSRWVTSAEAVARFVAALTPTTAEEAGAPEVPAPSCPAARRREPEWARRILDGAGL